MKITYDWNVTENHLNKIKARRAQLGISQERLARILGIHPSLITRYFRGDRPPPADFFEKVNAVLDREEAVKKALQETKEKVLKEWGA